MRVRFFFLLFILAAAGGFGPLAQEPEPVAVGLPLPDAPELAARGEYPVGVRTLTLTNAGVPDVPAIRNLPDATTDRELTLEVWYPAADDSGAPTTYTAQNGLPFVLRSARDAAPLSSDAPFPLLVVSHGLNGSRVQMAYLADHLASYGYVVASIDHNDPLLAVVSLPAATYYRPLDIRFVLDAFERLSTDSASFLSGLVDAQTAGLIGYSYGGYGTLVVGGAGIAPEIAGNPVLSPQDALAIHAEANVMPDPRVRAIFTLAPFGGDLSIINGGLETMWTPDALANITAPLFVLAGDDDEISQYATGIVPVYENAIRSERFLLTVPQAGHNIAQGIPPIDPRKPSPPRLNNAAQHYAAAFFGVYVQGKADYAAYLADDWLGWPAVPDGEFVLQHIAPES